MNKNELFLATEGTEDSENSIIFSHELTRIHTNSSIIISHGFHGLHGFFGPQRTKRAISRLWRLCPNLCSMQASTEASSTVAGFPIRRDPIFEAGKNGVLLANPGRIQSECFRG